MNRTLLTIILSLLPFLLTSQKKLLDNPVLLEEIRSGLGQMYNFNFAGARSSLEKLRTYSPEHPAVPFMEGLIIYWENFPLTLESRASKEFTGLMEECIQKSGSMLLADNEDLEAVFFDLFGRAFYVMYYSDNGKPGKVFPHLTALYRETIKGFDMKERFGEFYFSCGLYNYYIEAYPEKYPAYKPVSLLFRSGDRLEGLKQLRHAADKSIFLRAESNFFLSLLYLNYENQFDQASFYASRLYREYPNNPFYTANYLEILLFSKKYTLTPVLINRLLSSENAYSKMLGLVYNAYYLEKVKKDHEQAFREYSRGLRMAEDFGPVANRYAAIASMGLGRYYNRIGERAKANTYFRNAKSYTVYEHILRDTR